jgi:thioredoxin-related protein
MKNKLIVKSVILVLVFLLFAFLIIRIQHTANLKKKDAESILLLQPFAAYKNNKLVFIDKSKITKNYLLLAYISTECEHCDYMAEELKKYEKNFINCNIVLVAMGTEQSLHQFTAKHNLGIVNNINILWDKEFKIKKQFAVSTTPEFFIYNRAGHNVLHIKGETKIENLLKVIQ